MKGQTFKKMSLLLGALALFGLSCDRSRMEDQNKPGTEQPPGMQQPGTGEQPGGQQPPQQPPVTQ